MLLLAYWILIFEVITLVSLMLQKKYWNIEGEMYCVYMTNWTNLQNYVILFAGKLLICGEKMQHFPRVLGNNNKSFFLLHKFCWGDTYLNGETSDWVMQPQTWGVSSKVLSISGFYHNPQMITRFHWVFYLDCVSTFSVIQ